MNSLPDRKKATVRRGFRLLASAVCVAGFLLVSDSALNAQTHACSQKTIDQLEDEAGEIRSWAHLADFYRHYRACHVEDASVEESYSDSVARLLANHWETLPQASSLFAHDSHFEKFALAGINITDSTDDLNRIDELAKEHCPAQLEALCGKIRKAIRENN